MARGHSYQIISKRGHTFDFFKLLVRLTSLDRLHRKA